MTNYSDPDRRARLADALKRLRHSAGLSQGDIAEALGLAQNTVSRMENGHQRISVVQTRAWCQRAGALPDRTAELIALAEDVSVGAPSWEAMKGQPEAPSAVGSQHVQEQVKAIEAASRTIMNFQTFLVPGLLQTTAYALRVTTSDGPIPDAAERVLKRMERQEAALDDKAKRLRFLIAEASLLWPLGTVAEQVEQVRRIAAVIRERPHVEVAILPMSSNPVWRFNPFTIYDDIDPDSEVGGPFVHLELLTRPLDEFEPSRVERYRRAYNRLREQAVTGAEALALLDQITAELRQQGGQTEP